MSELYGPGAGPATSNGDGAATARPTASQSVSPRPIRPTVILRQREEREALRRAEREQKAKQEQMERDRAAAEAEEARVVEERRRAAERRAAAGAAVGVGGGEMSTDPMTQRRQQRAQESQAAAIRATPRLQQTAPQPEASRSNQALQSNQMPQNFPSSHFGSGVPPASHPQLGEASATGASGMAGGTRVKSAFPHAFERWETLSAHWEGLTSFWIRKLQENGEEFERSPVSGALARQVSDLSAAGANLFHAVVELQRLRASSERKFQRWFYETKLDQEKMKESMGILQRELTEERLSRSSAIQEAVEQERANSRTQKQLMEMKRELHISKEEARRAWEELGRREQEERDRTISLQQGNSTVVGGVTVVPMSQGVPSRSASGRDPGSQHPNEQPEYATVPSAGYPEYSKPPPATHPATTSGAGPSSGYYQPHDPTEGMYGAGSEGGYSEEDYEGQASQDIPTTQYPPSSSQWATQQAGGAPEYSGQGYAAPGWETMQNMPRHHHPTRLSDVIEEDERSRTSASQVSRV